MKKVVCFTATHGRRQGGARGCTCTPLEFENDDVRAPNSGPACPTTGPLKIHCGSRANWLVKQWHVNIYSVTSEAHKTTTVDLPEESFFGHWMLCDVTAQTTLQYNSFVSRCPVVTAVLSFTSSLHSSWLWSRPHVCSCRLE